MNTLFLISREYNVFSLGGKAKTTGLNTPMVMDTSGLWIKRNGLENNLLCGHIPLLTDETRNFSEDEYLNNVIKPSLINRVPDFRDTEVFIDFQVPNLSENERFL